MTTITAPHATTTPGPAVHRLRTVLRVTAATSFAAGTVGLLATDRVVDELGLQSAGWTSPSCSCGSGAACPADQARATGELPEREGVTRPPIEPSRASQGWIGRRDVGYRLHVTDPATTTPGATESYSPLLPDDLEDHIRAVLERVAEQELSLATAESCTGGMLASILTDVQDLSGVFERGFVVYSEPAKCELLGLVQADIDRCGVVSEEIAVAMAEGALANSRADIAVSTTGYADDGPEPGLVHFACARRDGPTTHREERFGAIGRGPVRIESMRVALQMIDEVL